MHHEAAQRLTSRQVVAVLESVLGSDCKSGANELLPRLESNERGIQKGFQLRAGSAVPNASQGQDLLDSSSRLGCWQCLIDALLQRLQTLWRCLFSQAVIGPNELPSQMVQDS
jgi:hypothetical protein